MSDASVNRPVDQDRHRDHWFEEIADHLADAYLRYSFTKGTVQEIDFLQTVLSLTPSMPVLDVGCGPGRHSLELARRGMSVHGIDISETFIEIARERARSEDLREQAIFRRLDARELPGDDLAGQFEVAVCLCQGAFGLMTEPGDDERVISGIRACLRPGGRLALSAFNAYFAVKYHETATFDADSGVSHEITDIRDPSGQGRVVDLWTGCYTPRELRSLLRTCGFSVDSISSVEPGAYSLGAPTVETPEFLVLATAV